MAPSGGGGAVRAGAVGAVGAGGGGRGDFGGGGRRGGEGVDDGYAGEDLVLPRISGSVIISLGASVGEGAGMGRDHVRRDGGGKGCKETNQGGEGMRQGVEDWGAREMREGRAKGAGRGAGN